MKNHHLSYSDRARHCHNPVAKKLLALMDSKQTNLGLSADHTSAETLLKMADAIGPEICIFKTHADIIEDFTSDFTRELQNLAEKHNFLIFEDRKFADIGNTVKQQYQGGVHRIADWADIINAHCLPGPGIISGLAEVGLKKQRALLLLAQMSSAENLFDENYIEKTLAFATKFPDFVIGFISQRKLADNPAWIYMTPGVQLSEGTDNLGQQYITPRTAIREHGSDIIIVGRGIVHDSNPVKAAKEYRLAAWEAYKE